MSCIVYQTNKKTGIKYAYESVSYWDKEKNQPRSKRKYLGRVDPETNEIIRSSGRKTHSEDNVPAKDSGLEKLHQEISRKDEMIQELRRELKEEKKKTEQLLKILQQIRKLTDTGC